MSRLKGPGNEGREAARPILEIPDGQQMPDPVFKGVQVAEHHGGSGSQPEAVGRFHDLQPFGRGSLPGGYLLPDPIHQDFSSSAGDGAQTGFPEPNQDLFQAHP